MRSIDRRGVIAGGTAFVASCLCRGTANAAETLPQSFDMIAYCCLDCAKCDVYEATMRKEDSLRAKVAARWNMKPDQIECLGCKSAKALFNCTLKQCASKRGLSTCAHCPDFVACKDEQWTRYPTLREAATAMRAKLG